MKPNTPAAPADPVLLLILSAWLVIEAVSTLVIATAALLLTATGWRPGPDRPAAAPPVAPPPPVAMPAPVLALPPSPEPPAPAPVAPLEALPVAQLRRLARAAGLPQLGRSGRRADLLQALAPVPG